MKVSWPRLLLWVCVMVLAFSVQDTSCQNLVISSTNTLATLAGFGLLGSAGALATVGLQNCNSSFLLFFCLFIFYFFIVRFWDELLFQSRNKMELTYALLDFFVLKFLIRVSLQYCNFYFLFSSFFFFFLVRFWDESLYRPQEKM